MIILTFSTKARVIFFFQYYEQKKNENAKNLPKLLPFPLIIKKKKKTNKSKKKN
jgi:hypothetical protein